MSNKAPEVLEQLKKLYMIRNKKSQWASVSIGIKEKHQKYPIDIKFHLKKYIANNNYLRWKLKHNRLCIRSYR